MSVKPSSLAVALACGAAATIAAAQSPAAPASPAPPPVPVVMPPANPAATATLADIAARARAAREAPPPPGPAITPLAPLPGGMGLLGATLASSTREPGEPRLLSIVGRPGQERVEISVDGVIYTASLRHPALGTTSWRLTGIDSAEGAVRMEGGAPSPGRSGTAKGGARPGTGGHTISFSRRDPDAPAQAPGMAGAPMIPAPMLPAR